MCGGGGVCVVVVGGHEANISPGCMPQKSCVAIIIALENEAMISSMHASRIAGVRQGGVGGWLHAPAHATKPAHILRAALQGAWSCGQREYEQCAAPPARSPQLAQHTHCSHATRMVFALKCMHTCYMHGADGCVCACQPSACGGLPRLLHARWQHGVAWAGRVCASCVAIIVALWRYKFKTLARTRPGLQVTSKAASARSTGVRAGCTASAHARMHPCASCEQRAQC